MSPNKWSGEGWEITVSDTEMTVAHASGSTTVPGTDATRFKVRRRWFQRSLHEDDRLLVVLRGITKDEASTLRQALGRLALMSAIADAAAWHATATQLLARACAEQRWIPTEAVDALLATRPEPRLLDRIRAAGSEPSCTKSQLEAMGFLDTDIEVVVARANEQIMAAELSSQRAFFDTIEKSPLTDEQARAVVCFDNRVQVIAAAGIDSSRLMASTFHSFGLDVIGQATGAKPRLARALGT
ncbi:MAG: hypothetical protein ACYDGN_06840 [Acidimicrobiales bacterium]